jgi:hypothetical protein
MPVRRPGALLLGVLMRGTHIIATIPLPGNNPLPCPARKKSPGFHRGLPPPQSPISARSGRRNVNLSHATVSLKPILSGGGRGSVRLDPPVAEVLADKPLQEAPGRQARHYAVDAEAPVCIGAKPHIEPLGRGVADTLASNLPHRR